MRIEKTHHNLQIRMETDAYGTLLTRRYEEGAFLFSPLFYYSPVRKERREFTHAYTQFVNSEQIAEAPLSI